MSMKKLLVYLKEYTLECIVSPLFKMLEAGFDLCVPLVVAAVIDVGIAGNDRSYILWMCLVLVVLGLVGLTCSLIAQWFAAKAAVGFAAKVRHALFEHILSLSYTQQDNQGTATLITRMTSDINQLQNGVNMALRLMLRSPFVVFGAMVMAFTIDLQAALIFVVVIPLLCVVIFGIMALSMPLQKQVQAGLDQVLGIARENLTGVRVIRAFNRQEAEGERFRGANQALDRLQQFTGKISGATNPITFVIINLGIVAILYTGGVRVNTGSLTQGQVVALVNYMSQILVELIKMANTIVLEVKAMASAARVQAALELPVGQEKPQAGKTGDPACPVAVEFRDVSARYEGAGADSLTGISFRALRGQTVGVIGGTGCGKTTLVNLIPRFYDVSRGQVLVDGTDVREYDLETLRRKIGVVPQKAVLFRGTIRENLLWGNPGATDQELWAALETAQAAQVVRDKPGGLDQEVEQGGRNFSGGQRQRLTIARALVRQPEILILDDSASALDFATDAALRKAIRALPQDPTLFIVSQRAASIRFADQILVLEDGVPAGLGTHDRLLESCPVYKEIYDSQFKLPGEEEKKNG